MHNTERNRTNYRMPKKELIWLGGDIHIDIVIKIPFHKFSTKLHLK